MKRPLLIIAVCLSALVGSAVFVGYFLQRMYRPVSYTFVTGPEAQLTEELALDLTRRALIEDGKGSPRMRPFRLGPKPPPGQTEFFLSRNTINPNQGDVRWHTGPGPSYSVEIELHDGEAVCTIYREH